MTIETHIDDDPLVTGEHEGADAASSLFDPDLDFRTAGVAAGLAIFNDTQVTDGNVTSVTENNVESGITWDKGDTYSIYKTATKDSFISRIGIDKSRGWKYTDKRELTSRGWFPRDVDIDKDTDGYLLPVRERPFSKGRPKKSKRVR